MYFGNVTAVGLSSTKQHQSNNIILLIHLIIKSINITTDYKTNAIFITIDKYFCTRKPRRYVD